MKRLHGTKPQSGHESSDKTSSRKSSSSGATSKTISSTGSRFRKVIHANRVLEPINSTAPNNFEDIKAHLNRPRDTTSPDEADYRNYVYRSQTAPNESSMLYETLPLLKRYEERGYRAVFNQPFTDFPAHVGFNNGLSVAQPDLVEGIDSTEYNPYPVRERLGGAAVPTPDPNALALAQMAGEWKGPGKDMVTARNQAAYAGASLVYGRNKARTSIGKPDPAGHSYVSSFTTDGTTVNTFAHFAESRSNQTIYNQYPVTSTLLTASFEDYKKGRRQLRNLQDLAKANSYALRDELLEYIPADESEKSAVAQEPDPNPDELAGPQTTDYVDDGYYMYENGTERQSDDEGYEIVGAAESLDKEQASYVGSRLVAAQSEM